MGEMPSHSDERLRVVALVASAGGLEAVSSVLGRLPESLSAAVLVLIHQSPERKSVLVRLLQSHSRLPVIAAEDGMRLRSGTIVVTPPGTHMLVSGGPSIRLIVSGASPPSRPSADLLLATLATTCADMAVAVVLSGGGHDGATGATAIHHFGGIVVASSEATSTNFSMPRATIERDKIIDHVVGLGEIGELLDALVAAPALSRV
jgi:two-component system, chemotaxis family, protein-glutamate methylesterase/glutaminase